MLHTMDKYDAILAIDGALIVLMLTQLEQIGYLLGMSVLATTGIALFAMSPTRMTAPQESPRQTPLVTRSRIASDIQSAQSYQSSEH